LHVGDYNQCCACKEMVCKNRVSRASHKAAYDSRYKPVFCTGGTSFFHALHEKHFFFFFQTRKHFFFKIKKAEHRMRYVSIISVDDKLLM